MCIFCGREKGKWEIELEGKFRGNISVGCFFSLLGLG